MWVVEEQPKHNVHPWSGSTINLLAGPGRVRRGGAAVPFELLQLPGPPSVDIHSPCDKISLSSSGVQQWCLNTLGCVVVAGELSPGQDRAVVFGVGVLG